MVAVSAVSLAAINPRHAAGHLRLWHQDTTGWTMTAKKTARSFVSGSPVFPQPRRVPRRMALRWGA